MVRALPRLLFAQCLQHGHRVAIGWRRCGIIEKGEGPGLSLSKKGLRRRELVLDFLLASGEVSKARATLRRWNRENPDRIVAWEWVEEAVIAKIRGDALVHRRPNDALEHLQRHREFTRRLPGDLVERLFTEAR
jgi:hypothetical protein